MSLKYNGYEELEPKQYLCLCPKAVRYELIQAKQSMTTLTIATTELEMTSLCNVATALYVYVYPTMLDTVVL